MQKSEAIERGIERNDIKGLREAIGSICYINRDFSSGEFDEAVCYVESKGIKLKDDALNGELISKGKTVYTDEDFESAVFELKENFCDERIADVKKIGKSLYAKKKPVQAAGTSPNVYSHQPAGQTKGSSGLLMAIGILAVVIIILFILIMM